MNNFENFNDVQSDRFDPDTFDPSENASGPGSQAATSVKTARPGQKLQLNITLSNPGSQNVVVELFSALDSVTTRCKAELVIGGYLMLPQTSIEGLAAAGVGIAGFDKLGNLKLTSGTGGESPVVVSCNEYPYRSLFESTKALPFQVNFVRFTSNTDAQIDNNIYHFSKTIGGANKQNVISPRAYFKPNQFQSRTIDILAGFAINGESGLQTLVNSGESVRLAFFISRWASSKA